MEIHKAKNISKKIQDILTEAGYLIINGNYHTLTKTRNYNAGDPIVLGLILEKENPELVIADIRYFEGKVALPHKNGMKIENDPKLERLESVLQEKSLYRDLPSEK